MSQPSNDGNPPITPRTVKRLYMHLLIAAAILLVVMHIPPPAELEKGILAMRLLGVIASVVYLWVTEAIPHAASATLLIIMASILGIGSFPVIFRNSFGSTVFAFFLGIMAFSAACKKCGLSRRIGNLFMLHAGTSADVMLFGVMLICFFISMFITDMAAVAIVLPVAMAILSAMGAKPLQSNYGKCMTLGVSWASIYGGICTPAGVGSNIATMKLLSELAGLEVDFLGWMKLCTPIGLVGLVAGFFVLKLCFRPEVKTIPVDKEKIRMDLRAEKMTVSQKYVAVLFVVVVVSFLTSGWTGININWISFTILPLLILPGVGIFKNWKEFESSLNWGAIILAVAGVSLGILANDVGLAQYAADKALKPLADASPATQVFAVALLTDVLGLFLSSMTITASVCVPVAIAFAQQTGAPVWAMAAAACCASSTVIVLVTQTPTLILSYAEGYYTLKDCAKAGVIMTVLSAVLTAAVIVAFGIPAAP